MSSWFGFGGSKQPEEPATNYDEPMYDYESTSTGFGAAAGGSPPSLGNASAGMPSGSQEVQQMLMEEQQRALIQQAIAKITNIAWDKCSATKPDQSLSSKESECIRNVTAAYLDTSVFVMRRLNKPGSA